MDRGQLIAYVGDSGNAESTGPHCHFELRKPSASGVWNSQAVNAKYSLEAAQPPPPRVAPETFEPWDNSRDLVVQQYADFLGRAPDGARSATTGVCSTRERTTRTGSSRCCSSPRSCQQSAGAVVRLYNAYFGRNPDQSGFAYWVGIGARRPAPGRDRPALRHVDRVPARVRRPLERGLRRHRVPERARALRRLGWQELLDAPPRLRLGQPRPPDDRVLGIEREPHPPTHPDQRRPDLRADAPDPVRRRGERGGDGPRHAVGHPPGPHPRHPPERRVPRRSSSGARSRCSLPLRDPALTDRAVAYPRLAAAPAAAASVRRRPSA